MGAPEPTPEQRKLQKTLEGPKPGARGVDSRGTAAIAVRRATESPLIEDTASGAIQRGVKSLDEVFVRVRTILEKLEAPTLFRAESKTLTVMLILPEVQPLAPAQVRELLERLRQVGILPLFFGLHPSTQFRAFLVEKQVPWTYVRENWQLSAFEIGSFIGGFALGIGKDFYETLHALAQLVKLTAEEESRWLEVQGLFAIGDLQGGMRMAFERLELYRQVFLGIVGYLHDLDVYNAIKGFAEKEYKDFLDQLWNLEFQKAGMKAGQAAAILIPLGFGLVKVVAGVSKAALLALRAIPIRQVVTKAAPAAVKQFLEDTRALLGGAKEGLANLALPDGSSLQFTPAWEGIGVHSGRGGFALGSFKMSEMLSDLRGWTGFDDVIDALDHEFGNLGKQKGGPKKIKESAAKAPKEPEIKEPGGKSRSKQPLSALQKEYADRARKFYPDRLWQYIKELEQRFPRLKKIRLRPWGRPRIADEWMFQERMLADQGYHSLVGKLDGRALQFDDLTHEGWIIDSKFRTGNPEKLLDDAGDVITQFEKGADDLPLPRQASEHSLDMEAAILDQMRRQMEVAERVGLQGVRWETNNPEYFRYLEDLVIREFRTGAKGGVSVEVALVL